MIAARLAADVVALPVTIVSATAVIVLAIGLARAVTSKQPARRFLCEAQLALELFLAAGLIRLAALETLPAFATIAAIVVVRQIIGRGLRAGVHA